MTTNADTNELRLLVRKVLQEVLPSAIRDKAQDGGVARSREPVVESVSIRDDVDLDRFVRQILTIVEDPLQLAELRAGRRRFKLEGHNPSPGPQKSASVGEGRSETPASHSTARETQGNPVHKVEEGVVTESLVTAIARERRSLLLGPRAIITPLARDRARQLGLNVERET